MKYTIFVKEEDNALIFLKSWSKERLKIPLETEFVKIKLLYYNRSKGKLELKIESKRTGEKKVITADDNFEDCYRSISKAVLEILENRAVPI